ncbi:MAG: NAD(P)-dependent oxidoreductase [Burkholderiales bacterium]|nr:NAD(P)-dependent oxidoreductase [Burkholderiales bacterium]
MRNTIAITGAAGVVGTALRPELAALGYALVLIDRSPVQDLAHGERAVQADVRDIPAMKAALAGCTGVLHLASCTTDAPWSQQVALSVEGTISLFEAVRAVGVGRVVYASSHHVVGFHPRGRPIGSAAVLLPDSRYGVGKAFGESLAALYACKFGLQCLAIRIGNVNTRPIDRRRLGNWISPRDLASLVAIGFEHPDILFDVVYGISDGTGRDYDNTRAFALGYAPHQSMSWEAQVMTEDPPAPPGTAAASCPAETTLGGAFSQSEFTGSPQRLSRLPGWI